MGRIESCDSRRSVVALPLGALLYLCSVVCPQSAVATDTEVMIATLPTAADPVGGMGLADVCLGALRFLWDDEFLSSTRERGGRLTSSRWEGAVRGPEDAASILDTTGADILLWGEVCGATGHGRVPSSGWARYALSRAADAFPAGSEVTCLSVTFADPARFRLRTPVAPPMAEPPAHMSLGTFSAESAGVALDLVVASHLIANGSTSGSYQLLEASREATWSRAELPALGEYLGVLGERLHAHWHHKDLLALGKVYDEYVDAETALAYQGDALAFAEGMGDDRRIAMSLLAQGRTLAHAKRWDEAVAVLEQVAGVGEQGDSSLDRYRVAASLLAGKMYFESNRQEDALATFTRTLERIEGFDTVGPSVRSLRAELHHATGIVHRDADRHGEALAAFEAAVGHCSEERTLPKTRARYLRSLADSLWGDGRKEAAAERYREVRRLYEDLGEIDGVLHTTVRIAEHTADLGMREAAVTEHTRLLEAAADTGNRQIQIDAATELAQLWRTEGETRPVEALTQLAGDLYGRDDDPELRTSGLLWLALSRDYAGDLDGAVRHAQQALAEARELGSRRLEVESLVTLAEYHGRLGDLDRQGVALDQAAALMAEDGLVLEAANTHRDAADIRAEQRHWEAALVSYERSIPLYEEAASPASAADSQYRAGLARRQLGDAEGAQADLGAAASRLETLGVDRDRCRVLVDLALMAEDAGESGPAIELLERARTLADEHGDAEQAARARFALGRLFSELEQLEEATRFLNEAVTGYSELEMPLDEGEVLRELGAVLSARGDHAGAREIYLDAIDRFAREGDPIYEGVATVELGWKEVEAGEYEGGLDRVERGCTLLCETGDILCPQGLRGWLHRAWEIGQRESAHRAAAALAFHGETADARFRARAAVVRLEHPADVGGSGLVASEVQPGSNAEATGILEGDVIVTYDGTPVDDLEAFISTVTQTDGRPEIGLLVLRGDDRVQLIARGGRLGVTVTRLP